MSFPIPSCIWCRSTAHVASNCPSRGNRSCYRCGSTSHVLFSHCEPTAVPLSLPNVSVTHVYNNVENTESVSYSVNNEYSAFPLSPPVADTAVSTAGEANIDLDVHNITYDFNVIKTLKGIKMVHINVQSLLSKFDEFSKLVQDSKLDIISVNETWLTGNISIYKR